MTQLPIASLKDYQQVTALIHRYHEDNPRNLDLENLGKPLGLSALKVQRLFSRWAGISPKRFAQYLSATDIKSRFIEPGSLMDISLDAGLTSTSRMHDHCVQFYAMNPQKAREQGNGLTIKHGFYPSPFGECHIATTDKGICWLAFIKPKTKNQAMAQLEDEWPQAILIRDGHCHQNIIDQIFYAAKSKQPLFLHIKGSNFQLRVWEALLKIPSAQCARYQDIAQNIGKPKAARAVGSAIGKNPISWLIPCHRVIRSTGIVGHYRWGETRKKSILAWEKSVS